MIIPKWKNPNRKRKVDISYDDKDYTKYYDIDLNDFQSLLIKLKYNILLSLLCDLSIRRNILLILVYNVQLLHLVLS